MRKFRPDVAIIGTRGYPSFYGGFETAVRHLVPAIVAANLSVLVYCRDRSAATLASPMPNVRSVHTWGLDLKSLSTLSFGASASIHSAVLKPRAALIMNVANGYWLPLLKLRGIPTIVNVDGIEWERAKWGKIARAIFYLGAKLTARFADELIFDSKEIAAIWDRKFGRVGHFIPYGANEYEVGEAPMAFPSGEYVLMVARLVPENTVQEFLDAAEALSTINPVVIVGTSGYGSPVETRLRQLVSQSTNIHWLGHIRDDDLLAQLWAHCGVYFHGHSVGGTNPALVQAMACGAPTVARDTAYNREVLGSEGHFTEPSADAITSAVTALMQDGDKRRTYAAYLRARAMEHYTWQDVCNGYVTLLKSAMAK